MLSIYTVEDSQTHICALHGSQKKSLNFGTTLCTTH